MGLPLSKNDWPDEYSSYVVKSSIASKGQTIVFRALCKTNKKQCVIKQKIGYANNSNDAKKLTKEIEREIVAYKAFLKTPHDNIIKYYRYFVEDYSHYFVMESMLTNLARLNAQHYLPDPKDRGVATIPTKPPINNVIVATILRQVLEALKHMHAHGMMHRNVKLENILINKDGTVKLCDFSILGQLNEPRKSIDGTVNFQAPETFQGKPYNEAADIWSFGIVSIALSTGRVPNEDLYKKYGSSTAMIKQELQTIQEIFQTRAPPDLTDDQYASFGDESFRDVISGCMKVNPNERKTASELLELQFFGLQFNYNKGSVGEWVQRLLDELMRGGNE